MNLGWLASMLVSPPTHTQILDSTAVAVDRINIQCVFIEKWSHLSHCHTLLSKINK